MSFTLSIVDVINFLFIAAGIGICSLCIMQIGSGMHIRKEVRGYFQVFFTSINVYISMHLIRMLISGHPGKVQGIAIRIATFLEFFVSGIMTYLLFLLILYLSGTMVKKKVVNIVAIVLLVLHGAGLLVSQYSNFYYYFDEMNVYHRSPGYPVSNTMQLLFMVQCAFFLLKYKEKYEKRLSYALWLYLLLPLIAVALQFVFDGVQFIILASVISSAFLYYVIIRIQLERYQKQQIEKDRIDNELTMATRIQAETLPNIFPAFPERDDFNIHASMKPAKEVGGDFYDFFLIDEKHLGLVMADVSGKGVPAALFMMVSKILIQNLAMMGNAPADVLRMLNNQLCSNNPEDMFVTVWYGCLDLDTGVLKAANAGHEYPFLKKADGSFEMIKDTHGLIIGGFAGATYKEYELQMDPGSKLFIYTDGVPEATDSDEQLFNTERLLYALRGAEKETPKDIIERVDLAVKDFVKGAPQFDDLTMLCLEYIGPKGDT